MRLAKLLLLALPMTLSAGCVYSHRPVAYSTPSTTTTTVYTPTPTSTRPAVRVYHEAPEPGANAVIVNPTVPGEVRTTPTSSDLGIADSIRQMFDADPSLAERMTNTRIAVSGGVVTLDGTVPTRTDKNEVQRRIATIPSVTEVNNRLDLAVPGR